MVLHLSNRCHTPTFDVSASDSSRRLTVNLAGRSFATQRISD
ncbi:hypothetical protein ACSYAD_05285 [Acaryochloris marina NIES-2412]